MGLRSSLSEYITKGRRQTSPAKLPQASAAFVYQDRGRVGKANVALFRNWSEHSEWVRAAINVRKAQVSSADWDIVPFDTEGTINQDLQAHIRRLFYTPNAQTDSFRSFIEPIVEDLLVLDAGVIEKVPTMRKMIGELWPVDGGTIKVNAFWDGDEAKPRYYWYPDATMRQAFNNREMVYIMANPATYRPIGLSPLETLKYTIDAELAGSTYNARQVQNAAPDGMIDLGEGARPDQVEKFESYWKSEIAGRGAMAFIGGSRGAKFVPFRASNRDMQFLEWQTFLVRKIASVFGLSPQDLGLTFDINRANSEVLQENTDDRGLRPLMALLQEYLTREIVWDRGFGGPDNNLAFRFTRLNLKETLSRAQINKLALAGVPWKSVNEARLEDGREPWGTEFDTPMMVTPTGAVTLDDVPTAREVMEGTPAASESAPEKAIAAPKSKG